MDKQHTVKSKISFQGVALHTGEQTKVEILPAPENTGVVFVRKDVKDSSFIKADFYSVQDPEKFPRRTSVGGEGVYVHTIEHLMAAFHLLGVDNVHVNVWGEEIPGLDGSAKAFVDEIRRVGVKEQEAFRKPLVIREPVWVQDNGSSIVVLPYSGMRISYLLNYKNPHIGSGYLDVELSPDGDTDFYQARTFCLQEEVQPLLDMGLGKGSNYENTLVVSEKGVVKNTLRCPDEFAKHKILDLVGDLYLAGVMQGHVIATRSGHGLNIKLLQRLRRYAEKVMSSGVRSRTGYTPTGSELSVEEIMRILPHRYPFLLVDRIIELEPEKRAVGLKSVTMNESFFQGHFPGKPVMPGVLIIEAMAQVGGVLMLASEENHGKLAFFMAVNNVKFRKTVLPGDQLVIEVVAGRVKKKTGTVLAKAYVQDKLVCEGELMFVLVDS